jgi:hypothetical protein
MSQWKAYIENEQLFVLHADTETQKEREREWIAKLNYPCYKIHVVDLYVPLHHQSFTKRREKKEEGDRQTPDK